MREVQFISESIEWGLVSNEIVRDDRLRYLDEMLKKPDVLQTLREAYSTRICETRLVR